MEPYLVTYQLETADGKMVSGLIVEMNADAIVLQDAKLEIYRIPTDEVETLEMLEQSIMPGRLLSNISAQEAADLLEYLPTSRGGT